MTKSKNLTITLTEKQAEFYAKFKDKMTYLVSFGLENLIKTFQSDRNYRNQLKAYIPDKLTKIRFSVRVTEEVYNKLKGISAICKLSIVDIVRFQLDNIIIILNKA